MNLGRRGPLVAAGAALLVALLAVFLLVLPKRNQVAAADQKLQQQQQQEQQLRLKLAQYEADKANNAQAETDIARSDERVPSSRDERSIIDLLSAAADQAGVDFAQLDPGPVAPSTDGTFGVITTSIGVGGSYAQLIEFLHNLETLPRATRVLSGAIQPGGATGSSGGADLTADELNMTLSAEFYTSDTGATASTAPVAGSSPSETTSTATSGGAG